MRATPQLISDAALEGLTVGVVMREALGTTLAFVSWYLREGADQIVICFDDANDPAITVLEHVPGVYCLPCTPEFWGAIGVVPTARFPKRQNRAMNFVYRSLRGGWFLNVDGDELLHLDGRRLVDELAHVPADVRSLTVRPAENIQTVPNTGPLQFRRLMTRPVARAVYGEYAGMMVKRGGLSGHTIGKTVNRAGIAGVIMRQHFLQNPQDGEVVMDRIIGAEEGGYLLHFFDQGYDVWRAKLPWRLSSSGFTARAANILNPILAGPDPEPELRRVYDNLHVFDAQRLALLKEHDVHFEVGIDFDALIESRFPGMGRAQSIAAAY